MPPFPSLCVRSKTPTGPFLFGRQGPRHPPCLLAQHAGTRGYQTRPTASPGVWWDVKSPSFKFQPLRLLPHLHLGQPQSRAGSGLSLPGGQGRCSPLPPTRCIGSPRSLAEEARLSCNLTGPSRGSSGDRALQALLPIDGIQISSCRCEDPRIPDLNQVRLPLF